MLTILMMSAKMVTLGLVKIKVFWNKGYDVIICRHQQNLSHDSNNVVCVWSCDQVWPGRHKLGLALGMALKFYTSLQEGLKLKVRTFYGLVHKSVEVTWEKLVGRGGGGGFKAPPILNRVIVTKR